MLLINFLYKNENQRLSLEITKLQENITTKTNELIDKNNEIEKIKKINEQRVRNLENKLIELGINSGDNKSSWIKILEEKNFIQEKNLNNLALELEKNIKFAKAKTHENEILKQNLKNFEMNANKFNFFNIIFLNFLFITKLYY